MPGELIPYERPRGTIHSIESIKALSADRCNFLVVSDRTLYIIQNLAAIDVTFAARYALILDEDGYRPIESDDADYSLWLETVEALQLEVIDLTCDIESGLESIAASIALLAGSGGGGGGGGCPSIGSAVYNCVLNLDNEELLGPGETTLPDPGTEDPPEGYATWDEYWEYKCQASTFIWLFLRQIMVAVRNLDGVFLVTNLVAPIIAGLAGLLPAAFTPAGFVAFVAGIITIGLLAGFQLWYVDQMIDWWDDNKTDIVCALFSSGSSPEAITALSGLVEDAIQAIVSWGALAGISGQISAALGSLFGLLMGNGIVEPLFKTAAAVTDAALGDLDCIADCGDIGDFAYAWQTVEWGCWDHINYAPETCGDVGVDVTDEEDATDEPDDTGALVARTGPNGTGDWTYILFDFGQTVTTGATAQLRVHYHQPAIGAFGRVVFSQHQTHGQQVHISDDGENFDPVATGSNVWTYDSATTEFTWGPLVDIDEVSFRYIVLAWDINYDIGTSQPNPYGYIDSIVISDSEGGLARGFVGWE